MGKAKAEILWLCVGAAAAAVMLAALCAQPVWRFGDGAEYYALYLAVLEHARPYMTEAAWLDYSKLLSDGAIASMVPTDALRAAFPALVVHGTADFNHFWLYSALAAGIAAPLKLIGIWLAPHTAFMALHALLFGATLALAGRMQGIRGAVAALLLFLASPVLWFAAKVHTEFFTVALVLQTFVLASRGRFFYGALPIAVASTQNVSLAATVWLLVALGFLANHLFRRTASLRELSSAVAAIAISLLHPLYYLYRHGVVTPQLKAGGAEVGGNADQLLAVLIEPDIGLFPNWWFGVFLLAVCAILALRSKPKLDFAYGAVAVAYLVTNLFAQASTTNLNSGSVDLSRYALWYVPVFYGPLVWLLGEAARKPRPWLLPLALGVLATPLVAWNLSWYWPSRYERYTEPSAVSRFLQSRFPAVYDPPPEIFIERNSGYAEAYRPQAAVAGPDCRKLYVPQTLLGAEAIPVVSQHHCAFDEVRVAAMVADALKRKPQDGADGLYLPLDERALDALQRRFGEGRLILAAGADGVSALRDGWNAPESWGTWSNSTHPKIQVRIAGCDSDKLRLAISARGFAIPQNPRVRSSVSINGRKAGGFDFAVGDSGPKQLAFDYSCADARRSNNLLTIEFGIVGAAVPSALGLGADSRLLGIGVEWLDIRQARSGD